jgi:hypothetical protein
VRELAAAHKFITLSGRHAVAMREFFKRVQTTAVPAVPMMSVARFVVGRREWCNSSRRWWDRSTQRTIAGLVRR